MKNRIKIELNRISNKSGRVYKDLLVGSGIYKLIKSNKPSILTYHGIAPVLKNPINYRHISPDVFEKHLIFLKKHTHIISVQDFFTQKFIPGKKNVVITFDDGFQNNLTYALPILDKHHVPAAVYITGINNTEYPILWPDLHDLIAVQPIDYIDFDDIRFYKKGAVYKPFYNSEGLNLSEFLKTKTIEEKMSIITSSDAVQRIIHNKDLSDYWSLLTNEEIIKLGESKLITIGSHGFYHNNLGLVSAEEAKTK